MKGLWLEHQVLSYREEIPEPIPGAGQALIRMLLAGVCSTDLELVKGYYPFTGIPGHEFVGEVIESPADPGWIGKRVVGEINIACGMCEMCQRGLARHCENRRTLGIHDWNGVFAEYLVLPTANLHEVPPGVPDRLAVFTEPLAAAYEIIDQQLIKTGDRVLLVGAGRLGQLIAQVMEVTDYHPDVLVRHPQQRELLLTHGIHAVTVQDLPGKKYDVVIEASGSPSGFSIARQAVRARGTLVLKSTYHGESQVDLSSIVVDEITLVGSRCGPFEPALQLLEQGNVMPDQLIDSTFPLSQGKRAFERAAQPGVLKVLIKPGD